MSITKNLGDGYQVVIDTQPGPHGEHRRVKIVHNSTVVASMRKSAFERAVAAYQGAK